MGYVGLTPHILLTSVVGNNGLQPGQATEIPWPRLGVVVLTNPLMSVVLHMAYMPNMGPALQPLYCPPRH